MLTLLTMPCRCCQREIVFEADAATQECGACFTLNARPRAEGPALDVLKRAMRQRLKCDFHNAENSYQHVLLDDPDEHEALWGLALCRYGVEYVDDPRTGRRMPVVHGIRKKPMQLDSDFQQACELAPAEVCAQYEAEAEYIDNAMSKIRELAEACPPFDVFICHKTTRPDSEEYTEDYSRAFKLYHMLDKQGYRVFFAPMEMEGVAAGSDYEAGIYHALDTAKVMLVVCSNEAYLSSPWVRSEWQRFLEMADADDGKRLVPLLYGEMPPSRLPRDFRVRKLQAVQMGELGSAESIMAAVRKYAGEVQKAAPVMQPAYTPAPVEPQPVFMPAPQPAQPVSVQPERVSEESRPVQPAIASRELLSQRSTLIQTLKAIQQKKQRSAQQKPVPQPVTVPASTMPQPNAQKSAESDFRTTPCSNGCIIVGYSGKGGDLVIPAMIGGRRVVSIGPEAFRGNVTLTSVTISEHVSTINYAAFRECTNLQRVSLPDGLTDIRQNAFQSCYSLKEIKLPQGITAIESRVFNACHSLSEVILPEKVVSIGEAAFDHCIRLASVTLPKGLREIGNQAFYRCFALSRINLPDNVKLGKDVFGQCKSLPSSVTRRSSTSILGFIDKLLPF